MITGRRPEITIKFTEKPELPTEGKKVTLEIRSENNVSVKAEVNRKSLKKQVAKMDSFENWVASLSGKIKSISPDGLVELDEAGINVFEVKKKEPLPESTAASVSV